MLQLASGFSSFLYDFTNSSELVIFKLVVEATIQVSIAAYNSPNDFVVAGTEESIRDLKSAMDEESMESVELRDVWKAFHSEHMQDAPCLHGVLFWISCSQMLMFRVIYLFKLHGKQAEFKQILDGFQLVFLAWDSYMDFLTKFWRNLRQLNLWCVILGA